MATTSARYQCIKPVCITSPYPIILCDDNGEFVAWVKEGGITYRELDGTPYTPVGTIDSCSTGLTRDIEQRLFCDDNAGTITPYLVAYEYDETGAIIGTTITLIDGVTPYVPTGITRVCAGEDGDVEVVPLCDNDTPFIRQIVFDNAGVVLGTNDTTLDMTTPYVTTGIVSPCVPTLAETVDISLNEINLIPNASGAPQSLTVSNLAGGVQFGAFHVDTTHVIWTIEPGGAITMTFDGTAPISGTHSSRLPNSGGVWSVETAVAAKFIRRDSVDGQIVANQFKAKV